MHVAVTGVVKAGAPGARPEVPEGGLWEELNMSPQLADVADIEDESNENGVEWRFSFPGRRRLFFILQRYQP
jgi:hypothetical protein